MGCRGRQMLVDSFLLHLIYVSLAEQFDTKFYTMRIASLGAFIAFRLKSYTFMAFKRDSPTKVS